MQAGFDEEFDFVVVGSGGGSMSGSLVMRQAGKSVVVLEKTDLLGGATARSGGIMWIPNNRFMKEDGVEDSFEKAMTYLDATSGQSIDAPGSTRQRRAAYVTESSRMVDFLVGQGIKLRRIKYYPDYYDERPGGSEEGRTVIAELFDAGELGAWRTRLRPNFLQVPATLDESRWLPMVGRSWKAKRMAVKIGFRTVLARLFGKHWVTNGAALQGRMLKAALSAGVEFHTNVPVGSLVIEDGAVTGVIARKDGRDWRIRARLGVLVNAGGFAHNQVMRDRYQPGTSAKWTMTPPGDTGEMLQELMRIGAATAQMDEFVGNHAAIPPGRENTGDGVALARVGMHGQISKPHSIVVDQTGVRYFREAGSYMEIGHRILARNKEVPAIPSWWIVDDQFIQNYLYCGTLPGTPKPKEWIEAGFLKKADTIEDLARQCGVDPAALTATVSAFNVGARIGEDPLFHRGERAYDNYSGDPLHGPTSTLGPIEKPPFYAAQVVPSDVGTYGGVVTDTHARVLRPDGSIIPGLYATGVTTASVMGRYYPGAGSSVGPSVTWGYVAARHAAGLSNQ